jgi:light-regulated signal transduction histidine kinase (bacteriophytochrome)
MLEQIIDQLPTVPGDPTMLQLVFTNLLSNAFKYSRTKEMAIIEVGSVNGSSTESVVYVKDNGVGFDMAYANRLFGVFQRLHRAEDFEGRNRAGQRAAHCLASRRSRLGGK